MYVYYVYAFVSACVSAGVNFMHTLFERMNVLLCV